MPEYDGNNNYVRVWFFGRNKGKRKSCEYWINELTRDFRVSSDGPA
jgi:hypothetical protein